MFYWKKMKRNWMQLSKRSWTIFVWNTFLNFNDRKNKQQVYIPVQCLCVTAAVVHVSMKYRNPQHQHCYSPVLKFLICSMCWWITCWQHLFQKMSYICTLYLLFRIVDKVGPFVFLFDPLCCWAILFFKHLFFIIH